METKHEFALNSYLSVVMCFELWFHYFQETNFSVRDISIRTPISSFEKVQKTTFISVTPSSHSSDTNEKSVSVSWNDNSVIV